MAASPSPKNMKKSDNTNTTPLTDSTCPTESKLSSKRRRNSSPGVRLIRNRIYDSHNGKTCHQCRQKTVDFAASCKRKINDKQCTSHFCHKCLLNRYGEKAEEVALLNDWNCPKCRGICNCSFCMKKRGHQPTGRLVHAAKANGFASVSDMLHLKDSERSGSQETADEAESSKKRKAADKKPEKEETGNSRKESSYEGSNGSVQADGEMAATRNTKLKRRRSKNSEEIVPEGNGADFSTQKATPKKSKISKEALYEGEAISDMNTAMQLIDMKVPKKCDHGEDEMLNYADPIAKNKPINKSPNPKKKNVEVKSEASDYDIVLPQGTLLNCVDGIELPAEDVGHALQFLEFCEAFGEVLNMKKGQPQLLLRELFTGKSKSKSKRKHKLHYPSIVQFHIQLLSMMQKDLGKDRDLSENTWVQVLGEYISDSQKPLKQQLLDCLDMGDDRDEKLNSSKILRLLNFLCDEALGTTKFRSWIDEQNSKFVDKEKKAKEKLLSRRERERNMEKEMKKKLQDEIAKAIIVKNGAPLSISENEELISRIKKEVAQTLEVAYTLAGTLEVSETVDEEEEDCRLDAVRSEPIFGDADGHKFLKFWRLRGHLDETDILLQDIDIEAGDSVAAKERWYTYSTEQKATVEKYISSFRK
ncbi:hypothetical protein V6N13_046513 [Hibiscus sabdariffa]|uniref:DDT domain-containing protein n=1 Tax=Hibiscus sabdariffa TaxID=183260 RepID=A0ABR2NZE6_9ROSI